MTPPSPAPPPPPLSRRAAIYGLSLLTLLNFVNYIDRFILAGVLPSIGRDLHLSYTEQSFLGIAFLFVYFLVSPVFGRLGDRLSRTRLMALGIAVWSLATAAAGIARNLAQMLVARASVGVGEAAYGTISPALMTDYFPPATRGRAFALFYVAIPVGSAVGYLLGGALDHAFGWRSAFFIVGLPGLALALLTLTAPDPPRGSQDPAPAGARHAEPLHGGGEGTASASGPSFWTAVRALLGNRIYTFTVLGYAAYTYAIGGLAFWGPTFFDKVRGMELHKADLLIGTITVLAGLPGTFVGGYVGDWLEKRVRNGYLWLCGVSMLAAVPFGWLGLTSPDRNVMIAALFVAEFLAFVSTGPINVIIVTVVAVEMRATASALSIFLIHALGDGLAYFTMGRTADVWGWPTAVLLVPVMLALSGILWAGIAAWGRGERRQ